MSFSPAAAASATVAVSPAAPAAAALQTPWRETATAAPPGRQSSAPSRLRPPCPPGGRPPPVSRQRCSLQVKGMHFSSEGAREGAGGAALDFTSEHAGVVTLHPRPIAGGDTSEVQRLHLQEASQCREAALRCGTVIYFAVTCQRPHTHSFGQSRFGINQ